MTRRAVPVGLVLLALAAACGGREPEPTDSEAAAATGEAIERITQAGPVTATVSLRPANPRLGDRLTLTLSVEAAAGVTVELPAFGEALGRFHIVDYTPRSTTSEEGTAEAKTVASQRYTLDTPMSGVHRIPPLRIEFVDDRPGQAGGDAGPEGTVRELLTDELSITVASVLPEGAVGMQLAAARDRLDPSPRAGGIADWWPALALAGAVLALALAVVLWRKGRRARQERSAFEVAVERLRALEGRGLPGADEADAWYVELSDIVRRYLEDRFAVRAPELTTEEFLREAQRSPALAGPRGGAHRQLLASFLAGCDRVKFAGYRPDQAESAAALEAARRFVDETRPQPEEPEVPGPMGQPEVASR